MLFRSAARACGPRVIAVVLSGSLDDGTAGAIAVRERGGLVLAQDPEEAAYPGMPQSAITHVDITEIATAEQLGVVVSRLCRTPATPTDEQAEEATRSAALVRRVAGKPHNRRLGRRGRAGVESAHHD